MDLYSIFSVISQYVGTYHFLGYAAVFLSAFLETVPFSGLLVPSNIIIVMSGIFAYEGYLRADSVLGLAVLGGMLGDLLSWWLGKKYNHNYQNKMLAKKWPYFERAETFFKTHGGKSIFVARFVGPLRPFIAFVAGACDMPLVRFIFFSITSAVMWAASFFFLGYIVEGSLETALLWLGKADSLAFVVVGGIVVFFVARKYILPKLRIKKVLPSPEE